MNQLESSAIDAGVTLFEESGGSETDREFVAIRGVEPTMPLATSDLSLLATIGFSGLFLTNAGGGLIAYGRELPLGSTPTALATAHHLKFACTDGLLVPSSIRCGHNQVAKLSTMLHGILASGGGATPFVLTASSAITAGAGGTSNIYTTGPVKYTVTGGSSRLVNGIYDVGVDFGLQVLKESDTGDVYPSHVSIIARNTKFSFTTKDVELITEVGDGLSVSSFAQYFRQVAVSGQRVLPATTTHISVTATAGMITPGSTTLSHARPGETAMTFTPAKNTNLIVINNAVAIPTS
jgi:hypothetical protein